MHSWSGVGLCWRVAGTLAAMACHASARVAAFHFFMGGRRARVSHARRVAALVGGPVAAALAAMVCLVWAHPCPGDASLSAWAEDVARVIVLWAAVDILPIRPTSGGRVVVCVLCGRLGGLRASCLASAYVAFAIAALHLDAWWGIPSPLWLVLCAYNIAALVCLIRQERVATRRQMKAAFASMGRGDTVATIASCQDVLQTSPSRTARRDALRLLGYATAIRGDWVALLALLEGDRERLFTDDDLAKYEQATLELCLVDALRRTRALRVQRNGRT